jgi:hypothetical protein
MKTRYLLFILPAFILAACEPKIDEFAPSAGNADFSRYIAVGDFWTAGFADGSLYKPGQENSFPSMLSGRFATVGGGEFKQPLMVDDYGFGMPVPGVFLPRLVLGYKQDCKGVTGLSPVYPEVQVDPANFASIVAGGPYNNIGMPGLKSIYVGVAGFAALNPYFSRFAPSPITTVLEMIPPVNATFFTMAMGSFDVQYYAMQGGVGDQVTPVDQFTAAMTGTLQTLMANGAKGAVANVPDILDAAYFHTIPYNALAIPDQATADMLNFAYAGLNQIIKGAGSTDTLHFVAGPNPLVIADEDLPWGIRQIKSDELVLLTLPQDSLKCAGWGSQKPIPSPFILKKNEVETVQAAIQAYNAAIEQMVAGKDVALVDLHSVMKELYNDGLVFEGVKITAQFVTGNFYSLDGLNPTPRGSAVVAYHFIKAINEKFGANLPQVIVSDYEGVVFP